MIIRGPILNPRGDGSVEWIPDGVIIGDAKITFIGTYGEFKKQNLTGTPARQSKGIILPPFLDAHIHVPQHPIRGRFAEGVVGDPPEGRLLAGLNRNVFPTEGKCSDLEYARATIRAFLQDTLSQGVIGGAAYMTVHPAAAREALRILPPHWHAGLVLMNQNCPEYLRNNESTIDRDLRSLAEEFGSRCIITDRFAVACSSELRRIGVQVAKDYSLRTQTHLNEQVREKQFVEKTLYPTHASYTDVYRADGLLHHRPLLAHCIHMTQDEWRMLEDSQSVVMHCPTSNLLLGSGIMKLDEVREHGLDYAICTDVGASPTTSMLLEMAQYLMIHPQACATEALYRVTLAPAKILELDREIGSFETGKAMSFIEVKTPTIAFASAEDAIRGGLLNGDQIGGETQEVIEKLRTLSPVNNAQLDRMIVETRSRAAKLESTIQSVTIEGKCAFARQTP